MDFLKAIRFFASIVIVVRASWAIACMSLRLALGLIFFNDRDSIKRCLSSFTDGVDLMICIDGKFSHYPSKSLLSTDGSREVVKSFSNAKLVDFPNQYEHVKRQKYCELCGKYNVDVLIIADSDEYVIKGSSFEKFRVNLQRIVIERDKGRFPVYDIQEQTWGSYGDQFQRKPRVWYKAQDMHYIQGRHFVFRHKDPSRIGTVWEGSYGADLIEGIRLGHDHRLRSKQHMDGRFVYAKWLVDFEGKPEYL
jgi:hypothetical protein